MPGSYMRWLERRPWILESLCFGSSSKADRELCLGYYSMRFCTNKFGSGHVTSIFWGVDRPCSCYILFCTQVCTHASELCASVQWRQRWISTIYDCAFPVTCTSLTGPDDLPVRLHGDEGPGLKFKNVLVVNLSFPYTHAGESWCNMVRCNYLHFSRTRSGHTSHPISPLNLACNNCLPLLI